MPIATPDTYLEMLDKAKKKGFAYPAINVTSSQTLNAALHGFQEAESDGIVQITTGGSAYWSGSQKNNMLSGALSFAAYAREVAKQYDVNIALHTDHCPKEKLEDFVMPLVKLSEEAHSLGKDPIFNSHMWDGSAISLPENLEIASQLLKRMNKINQVLEIEVGIVGGEEDGVSNEINETLYSTVEDGLAVVECLGSGENGRYITAITFGNVHGIYKHEHVKLKTEILHKIQAVVGKKTGKYLPFDLVFHGGSGSSKKDIHDSINFGVVKMNIDTDTQYSYTRAVIDHMLKNYSDVLKIDGNLGNKKAYDPRTWGAMAEQSMCSRVSQACEVLGSAGMSKK